jgi:hypothetical protein
MSTHLEPEWLERYARGDLDQARSFSVEAHLPACADCRAQVAHLVDPARMERVWDAIDLAIDAPAVPAAERVLRRLGVPEGTARLVAMTPALRPSWLISVAAVLVFGLIAAGARGEVGVMLFLLAAPLLPVAGVAVAYGPHVDPGHEIGVAAPVDALRLVLLRAAAVLVMSVVLAALAALGLPGLDWTAAAWLLPALGLTLVALGLATTIGPVPAATLVGTVWAAAVLAAWRSSGDPLVAFGSAGQLICLLAAAAGALALHLQRETFEERSLG